MLRAAAAVAARGRVRTRRLLRQRWPGIIELGDLSAISEEIVGRLARTFNEVADVVVADADVNTGDHVVDDMVDADDAKLTFQFCHEFWNRTQAPVSQ